MTVNYESENTVLRLWLLLRRVSETLMLCQDLVFSKYGLSTEKWAVLASIKSRRPLRPSELSSIQARTPNSMSMLIDRMVRAGLVSRTRDRKDRRAVTVSLTSKAEAVVKPAAIAGWEFINEVLLPLSDNEQRTLANMLETVKCELDGYLNPEMDKAEILSNSYTNQPDLYKRVIKKLLPPGYKPKCKHGNMTVNHESENTVSRLWLLLRRVGETLMRCQDLVFLKYGLSTEKWGVVASIKSRGPLRPSDLSMMQARTPNSMSMLIDRMVKTGLVRRTRDRKDRRVVTVSLTSKAESVAEPAVTAGWEFIHEILSPLSDNEQRTLANMLETVKCELVARLRPEMDKEELIKNSFTNDPDLYKRMAQNLLPPGYESKRTHRNKPKLVHGTAAEGRVLAS